MKKLTAIITSVLMLVAMAMPQSASAFGKGEKSLNINGGYVSENNGGYMNVGFQWEFANHFRLAPDIGYAFKNDGKSAFLMDVDMHFPFRLVKGFGVYPLVGLTLNSWNLDWVEKTETRVGGNFGVGFDIYFTPYLKMNIQGKYSLMDDFSGAFIGLGIGYVF